MPESKLSGLIAAVPTPFDARRKIDFAAFIEHCRWCLANGCDGLNVLGTTGEANSLSPTSRKAIMTAAAENLDRSRLMVGTGTPDLETTIDLTRHAHALDYAAALLLPPYYYKPISDNGLFAWFAELIARTADAPIGIYLYNFPQLTGIEFSPALVERLARAFPERINGAKDSSGNLDYARRLAEIDGFDVFPSSEGTLSRAEIDNYAGCISATVNIDPASSADLAIHQDDAALHKQVLGLRQSISANPLIPAIKYLVSKRTGNPIWLNVAPPQLPISESAHVAALDGITKSLDERLHQPA
ncbi:dihydrodipicolinate synthase family protein [Mesorhizobium sp. CGMCC 1.15528]|uniref:Dihydrodipicolinate synthase family protein n=1 Tax=Mesorhizobium zhangyense TaxID=1776730 RepID=A0A7C9VHC1_9HYPH|nr:dihydrodipicolinate synthase family protein [Mesorhizobium zhangyense]NGN44488.1 dihydrodipicolinate synthase family protein [Mesorhizobium zhangyense]